MKQLPEYFRKNLKSLYTDEELKIIEK